MRTETDPDVKPYVHGRHIHTYIVSQTPEINRVETLLLSLFQSLLNKIVGAGLFHEKNPDKVFKMGIVQAKKSFFTRTDHDYVTKVRSKMLIY